VQPLRDCPEEQILNRWPIVHDLRVSDPDHVVAHQHQLSVVRDVGRALRAHVVCPVDLKDEQVSEEEVHVVPGDHHLRQNPHRPSSRSVEHERLKTGVEEGARAVSNTACGTRERQLTQQLRRDKLLAKCGIPDRDRSIQRLTHGNSRQHILHRINEIRPVTLDDRSVAMDDGSRRHVDASAMRIDRHVSSHIVIEYPQPESASLRDAAHENTRPCRCAQMGVCIRLGDPDAADAEQISAFDCSGDASLAVASVPCIRAAHHPAVRGDIREQQSVSTIGLAHLASLVGGSHPSTDGDTACA
jgi:hypothetical protein